jgi:hypothetical protein
MWYELEEESLVGRPQGRGHLKDIGVDGKLKVKVKVKGKVYSRTGHEGPEGEYRYSSTLSLTSGLSGVGGQRHAPATLPPGK